MNKRFRQVNKALRQQKYKPIMAVLHMDGALPDVILFDPRELEKYKALYGSAMKVIC